MSQDNNSNDKEKNTKNSSIKQTIVYVVVFAVSFLASYLLVGAIMGHNNKSNKKIHTIPAQKQLRSNNHHSKKIRRKPTQEELQIVKDAGFVKGFVASNTFVLKTFCTSSGYVPNEFISQFENKFSKTNKNADEILDKYFSKEDAQKLVVDQASKAGLVVLTNEYNKINRENGISKKDFCKLIDKNKDSIIDNKIKTFKQNKPNMYLD